MTYKTLSPRRPARPSLIFKSICRVQKILSGMTVKMRSVAELNTAGLLAFEHHELVAFLPPWTYPVSVCTSGDQHLLGSPTGFQRLCTFPHWVKIVIEVKRLTISCCAIREYRNHRLPLVLPKSLNKRNMNDTRPSVLHIIATIWLVCAPQMYFKAREEAYRGAQTRIPFSLHSPSRYR